MEKIILKNLIAKIKNPIIRLKQYNHLKNINFEVYFAHEGNLKVKLPYIKMFQTIFGNGTILTKNYLYKQRPNSEVLLRKIIYQLYGQGYIKRKESIIDIGCWIADNTIVWAKGLSENAVVFAIDPSEENLIYGKKLANLNSIENIEWISAVCSEVAGEKLSFNGNLDHATFVKRIKSKEYLVSTTLDQVISAFDNTKIGLLHVDVEGFELNVLKGAFDLISRDEPTVTFEQHISQEKVDEVSKFLKNLKYRVFMINEVLPGNSLDCRNFIAFPSSKELPRLDQFDQENGLELGVYSAVIGPILIEV